MFRCLIPALLLGLAGCATPDSQSKVTIHESGTDAPPRYEIIQRLWTESLASVAFVPYYTSVDEAKAAFREHAENLGGNGVINFGCYRLPGASGSGKRLACNGTIVRFL